MCVVLSIQYVQGWTDHASNFLETTSLTSNFLRLNCAPTLDLAGVMPDVRMLEMGNLHDLTRQPSFTTPTRLYSI